MVTSLLAKYCSSVGVALTKRVSKLDSASRGSVQALSDWFPVLCSWAIKHFTLSHSASLWPYTPAGTMRFDDDDDDDDDDDSASHHPGL